MNQKTFECNSDEKVDSEYGNLKLLSDFVDYKNKKKNKIYIVWD